MAGKLRSPMQGTVVGKGTVPQINGSAIKGSPSPSKKSSKINSPANK